MSPGRRKRLFEVRKRDGATRKRMQELTERTRREGRELSRRRRAETDKLGPVFAPVARFASWIAPYITGALMFMLKLFAALIALLAELGAVAASWLAKRIRAIATGTARWAEVNVTPRSTVAFVGIAAAVGLGVSQFFDFHGVAVDAPNYAGEVGNTAHVPIVGTETAGSAHLWILIPVAVAAVVLIIGAYRGEKRLAGAVALCGLLGLAVALAIDLPQGLDAGRPGLAFSGSDAVLLQGFWAEVACSAVLILCGGLLPLYSRGVAAERRGRLRSATRGRVRRKDGGVSPGLQTES
jgi:hypothetical protein